MHRGDRCYYLEQKPLLIVLFFRFQNVFEHTTCLGPGGQDRYSIVEFNVSTLHCRYTPAPVINEHLTAWIIGGTIGTSAMLALLALIAAILWCTHASLRNTADDAAYENTAYTITQSNGIVGNGLHGATESVNTTNGAVDDTVPKFRYTTHL